MPKLIVSDIERDRYYMDYVNTYLERDVRDLSQVGKTSEFYDFLVYVASRTAQELKYDEISKAIGVFAPTVKSWISILESSGIITILKPYSNNLTNVPFELNIKIALKLCGLGVFWFVEN